MNLTPHFTLTELQGNNAPASVQAKLLETARLLESVRSALGVPLRITSGYRDPLRNSAVGGVDGSQHTKGEAADFVPVGLSMYAAAKQIEVARKAGRILPFGQIIYYPPPLGGHLHISLPRGSSRDGEMLVKLVDGHFSFVSSRLLAKFPGATESGVVGGVAVGVALALLYLIRQER